MTNQNIAEQIEQNDNTSVHVSDELISDIVLGLEEERNEDVVAFLTDLNAADIAEVMSKIGVEKSLPLVTILGETMDANVFAYLDNGIVTDLFEQLDDYYIASTLNQLDSDDALDLIEDLDEDTQQAILKTLSKKMRAAIEEGLTFPEDSAGRLMQRDLVAVPQFWTVGKTLDFLRAARQTIPDNFYDIIIVDPMHHVVGEVPAGRILRAPRNERIENLTLDKIHPVNAALDQEDVAHIFRREGLVSAPVVDDDNRLIGVITVDDIVGVIDEEAEEDLLKLGGIANDDIYRDVIKTTRARFSWLAVNLLTAIAASLVIGLFEATLEQIVALAILMPIVASMGGNAGTQALTIAVRALATKELSSTNAWRVIGKEVAVGALNGISFAIIAGAVTWLWFDSPQLGTIIGMAMIFNLVIAGFSGAAIPVVLSKYGLDPAVSSGVFLTTITDMVGFFAFLGLAATFLI